MVKTCCVVIVVSLPLTVDSIVFGTVVTILLDPDSDSDAEALSDEIAVVLGSHHTGFVVFLPISSVVTIVVSGSSA